jgi:uncharacterized SAM-binding protein YcdF (DUF218 family)
MPSQPRPRRTARRTLRVFLALLVIAVAAASLMLYYGGRFLQHEDPLQKADAIFVLAGSRTERPLEGIELFKEGYAPIVALSPGRPEPGEELLRARGVRFPSEVELQRDALLQSGIPRDAIIATNGFVDNTSQEANLLRAMVIARGWRRVIIVTSKYHTRRSALAFRRGLEGTGAEPIMRASRYDASDPARWWRYRNDIRFVLSEWQKLVPYRLGLGD